MGDSVSEGTVLEWHKQEGDQVSEDEVLVEISTDKVDAEVPAPATGTVRQDPCRRGRHDRRRRRARRDLAGRTTAPRPPPPSARGRRRRRDASTSSCRRWASRCPRARSSSGPSSPATRSRRTRRSSRSRPTRSTPRCPPPPPGRSTRSSPQAGDTVTVGQVIARMTTSNGAAPAAKAPEPTAAPRPQGSAPPQAPGRHQGHAGRRPRGRRARASTSRRCTGPGPAGRISKADVLAAENGAAPPRRPRCSRAPARCSRATWTSRGRSRPPPRSAPSPSRRSTPAASSSRRPASGSPSRT